MLDVHGSVLRGLQRDENGNKIVGLGPTPGDLPDPGIEPEYLASPELAGGFFTAVPPGKLQGMHGFLQSHSFHWKKCSKDKTRDTDFVHGKIIALWTLRQL